MPRFCTVTISRLYASGGDEIARRLSERLGWVLFDRQVLKTAAEGAGLSERDMRAFDEPYFDRLNIELYRFTNVAAFRRPPMQVDGAGRVHIGSSRFDDEDYVEIVKKFVRNLHSKGQSIIAGRGGQCILGDEPNVLHLRVEAPMEFRVERCRKNLDISEKRAGKIVREMDTRQEHFLRHFFGVTGREGQLYHAVLNTGKVEIDGAVDLMAHLLKGCEKGFEEGK